MLARPRSSTVPKTRRRLINRCPLKPIKTAAVYRLAHQLAEDLATEDHPTTDQRQYLEELTELIYAFEEPGPDA